MFKPQQASQQTPQRFFTLEVQLNSQQAKAPRQAASPSYLLEKGRSFVNEGGGWGLALSYHSSFNDSSVRLMQATQLLALLGVQGRLRGIRYRFLGAS
jgi:hypothetical protein